MTTLPKLLAMGQKMPEMEERFTITYTPDETKYGGYVGLSYTPAQAYTLMAKGFVFSQAMAPTTIVEPKQNYLPEEWLLLQPGGN